MVVRRDQKQQEWGQKWQRESTEKLNVNFESLATGLEVIINSLVTQIESLLFDGGCKRGLLFPIGFTWHNFALGFTSLKPF